MALKTLNDIIGYVYMEYTTKKDTIVFSTNRAIFSILRQLYELDSAKNLAPESRIFIECENCISHMEKIVQDIFYDKVNTSDAISDELEVIQRMKANDDKSLLLMAERIKHGLTKNTDRLHGHIKYMDTNSNIMSKLDNNDTSMANVNARLSSIEVSLSKIVGDTNNARLIPGNKSMFRMNVPKTNEDEDDEEDDEDEDDEDDEDDEEI